MKTSYHKLLGEATLDAFLEINMPPPNQVEHCCSSSHDRSNVRSKCHYGYFQNTRVQNSEDVIWWMRKLFSSPPSSSLQMLSARVVARFCVCCVALTYVAMLSSLIPEKSLGWEQRCSSRNVEHYRVEKAAHRYKKFRHNRANPVRYTGSRQANHFFLRGWGTRLASQTRVMSRVFKEWSAIQLHLSVRGRWVTWGFLRRVCHKTQQTAVL